VRKELINVQLLPQAIISLSAGWALDDNPSLFDHSHCHHEETHRALGAVILKDGTWFPAFP